MENSLNNPTQKSKFFTKSKIILSVMVLGLILLAALVAKYKILSDSLAVEKDKLREELSIAKSLQEDGQGKNLVSERRVITSKPTPKGKLVAYRLTDDWSTDLDAGIYGIRLEAGDYWPVIFSTVSDAYLGHDLAENHVFDIVDNEIWVVNSIHNKIDVYEFFEEVKENDTIYRSHLIFKRAIDLPNYKVGSISSIECDSNTCTVGTAHHMESGCDMKLSIQNEVFSDIECRNMNGTFIPELVE